MPYASKIEGLQSCRHGWGMVVADHSGWLVLTSFSGSCISVRYFSVIYLCQLTSQQGQQPQQAEEGENETAPCVMALHQQV